MPQSASSTDACKAFLTEHCPGTTEKEWKRKSKSSGVDGYAKRLFAHTSGREVEVKESAHGLVVTFDSENTMPFSKLLGARPLNEMLFGGGSTTVAPTDTPEEKFLRVIGNGIDWSAAEGARSSFDFAASIDFNAFVRTVPDLYQRYVEYVQGAIDMSWEMAEGIATEGYDDSIASVASVLIRIEAAYVSAGLPLGVDTELVKTSLTLLEALKEGVVGEVEDEVEDHEAAFAAIDHLSSVLWRAKPPSARPASP